MNVSYDSSTMLVRVTGDKMVRSFLFCWASTFNNQVLLAVYSMTLKADMILLAIYCNFKFFAGILF